MSVENPATPLWAVHLIEESNVYRLQVEIDSEV